MALGIGSHGEESVLHPWEAGLAVRADGRAVARPRLAKSNTFRGARCDLIERDALHKSPADGRALGR